MRFVAKPPLRASPLIMAVVLLLAACAGDGVPPEERSALPEGWTRVQVREGFVARESDNPLAGFEIDLPPGWRAGEGWPTREGPSGWIAAVAPSETENVPMLRFDMGAGPRWNREDLETDPRRTVSDITVAGFPALLRLATDAATDRAPHVGVFYEHIPGGPAGFETPSLDIEGDNRAFADQALLTQVLTSVRYAEITALPELPAAQITPGDDWVRTRAPIEPRSFTLLLPPGWHIEKRQGIDSSVGVIEGSGISISYDFGASGGAPIDHLSRVREHREDPPLLTWEETLGNTRFQIARPISPIPHEHGLVAFHPNFLPRSGPGVTFYAIGLDGDQQELVLAILRTVARESE